MRKNNSALERVAPEQVGIPSGSINKFINIINDKYVNLHSFMLLRHGKIATEAYYSPYKKDMLHNIFSVTKSFTQAAIGIAIGEGLLGLDDHVVDYFPEKLSGEVHEYTKMMTIRHLLQMTTVHEKSTSTESGDWISSFLNTPPSHMPGTVFAYDTTGTHTLCGILQKVTGRSVHEYLKPRLFDPIGIGEIEWESCPMNINKGGSGIKCTTEDLARFGQLYLQGGCWDGVQVLPRGWTELSTARKTDNSNTRFLLDGHKGYAFKFWRTRHDSYCAFGMGGQFVLIIPDKDLVFVTTANTLLYKDGHQQVLDTFWETIYPFLKDESLPENNNDERELNENIKGLKLKLPESDYNADNESIDSWYLLDSNKLNYSECKLNINNSEGKLIFIKDSNRLELCFRLNDWMVSSEPFFGLSSANGVVWSDENTLIITCQLLDETQMFILTCHFENEKLVLQIQPAGAMKTEDFECYLNGQLMRKR